MSVAAHGQALNVVPVTIQMAAGQRASALTIVNQGDIVASFQLRAFRWSQADDSNDALAPSDDISVSPPLGTIAPGASQVVRIVLRPLAADRESSFRLLLDQIPAPAAPGTVRLALRLSLPVFAQPATRMVPHLRFHIERISDQMFLVAVNDGNRHEKLQDIAFKSSDGTSFGIDKNVSPYILAGATRRWHIASKTAPTGPTLQLTARAETGQINDQNVAITAKP